MRNVKVLGTGCSNCKATQRLIEETARQLGITVEIEKVEDIQKIIAFNVMSTPGVVVDGKVVHAGGVPSREAVAAWLRA